MSVLQGSVCPAGAVSCHYYLGSGREVEEWWSSMSLMMLQDCVCTCSHRQHPDLDGEKVIRRQQWSFDPDPPEA